jgi:AraC-like DNA-binding protein
MNAAAIVPVNAAALRSFHIINVTDPREMGADSRITDRLPAESDAFSYRLRDRALLRTTFASPITTITAKPLGSLLLCHVGDRFQTEVELLGQGENRFCLTALFRGHMTLIQNRDETAGGGRDGVIYKGTPGTRLLTSDDNARENLLIEAPALEQMLEEMLGHRLRAPLEFRSHVDWGQGLAASLRSQIAFLMRELERDDGLASSPVALASFTDLVFSLTLRGLPHNHTDGLIAKGGIAVPAYVRRAEDYMHANAMRPIRMEDVAHAAGCGLRTLGLVFRRFRDSTPLAALHLIRLEHIRAELSDRSNRLAVADIARRYGFTNPARFAAEYRRRFGEAPAETIRRGAR